LWVELTQPQIHACFFYFAIFLRKIFTGGIKNIFALYFLEKRRTFALYFLEKHLFLGL